MEFALSIVYVVSAYFLFQAIYRSQRRWSSCLYAVLGFVVFVVFYVIIVRIITSVNSMDLAATNKVLNAAGWVALIPLIIGANIPPRRA